MPPAVRTLALACTVAAVLPAVALAQQQTGAITGQVTEAGTREAIAGARVEAIVMPARRVAAATTTNGEGRYTMPRVPVGAYSVVITRIGYSLKRVDAVQVDAGGTARADVELSLLPTQLEQVVTSASRAPEKVLDAPASISIVNERQIRERPTVTTADYLRGVPGVDATQGGLAQTNVVARGFNNAFSGALLMLQDNRFAAVPSLRVNIPQLMSSTNEDIDRIEVVLGPGAALYGPNAANGVMHVITKSPFDSKGTTFTLDGGERSVFRFGARHANTIGDRVGFKLSGEMMRGKDWEYRDPAEPATFPATPATPTSRVGQTIRRDFDLERLGGEARLDAKVADDAEVILSYGVARVGNGLELTGANGTAQVRDWMMQHYQARFRSGRFFAQAFGNISNAGNDSPQDLGGTFLLRTGQPIVDFSRLGALQFQHGIDMGRRQTFLYGADYVFTNPRTGGTIHGRNEEDDNTTEVGGYVHSVTRFSPRWELVTALRSDYNSRLEKAFVSPRAAIVFKPTPLQNLRVSYNRAYSTPGSFQMFLDLLQGSLQPSTGLPYDIRALGVPTNGFTFRRDCTGGLNDLCMRSPFPYANGSVAANQFTAAVGYQNALAVALQRGLQGQLAAGIRAANPGMSEAQANGLAQQAVTRLRTLNPTDAQVGSNLRLLTPGNPAGPFATTYDPAQVQDIAPLEASFVNNLELGYKGIIGDRLRIAIDGWYQQRENFITAASNFTPTVFLGGAQTGAYIAPELAAAFQAAGLTPAQAAALAAGVTPSIATALATVPAGNVVPNSRLTDNADFAFTYRNIDETIDLFGTDVALDFQVTQRFSLAATYSWVSDVEFPEVQSGAYPLSLNAPDHKASLSTRWNDDVRGYSFDLRGRYANAFFVNTGVYNGQVPVNAFLDASLAWRPPVEGRRWLLGINATNILNNERASFAGVPEIGRLVLTRVQYSF